MRASRMMEFCLAAPPFHATRNAIRLVAHAPDFAVKGGRAVAVVLTRKIVTVALGLQDVLATVALILQTDPMGCTTLEQAVIKSATARPELVPGSAVLPGHAAGSTSWTAPTMRRAQMGRWGAGLTAACARPSQT